MLLVASIMGVINGIIALSQSSFFHDYGAHYVASNLTTWGWVMVAAANGSRRSARHCSSPPGRRRGGAECAANAVYGRNWLGRSATAA